MNWPLLNPLYTLVYFCSGCNNQYFKVNNGSNNYVSCERCCLLAQIQAIIAWVPLDVGKLRAHQSDWWAPLWCDVCSPTLQGFVVQVTLDSLKAMLCLVKQSVFVGWIWQMKCKPSFSCKSAVWQSNTKTSLLSAHC